MLKKINFFSKQFKEIYHHLSLVSDEKLNEICQIILKTKKNKGKIIIGGNGGSSATASHFSVDLSVNAGIKTINFNEYNLITALSNDFGYENWLSKCIEIHGNKNDLLILISCSGNSKNLIKAQQKAKKKKINVISLTGCKKNNKLNSSKNICKIWINSNKYNVIEIIHHTILLSIIDRLMKKK